MEHIEKWKDVEGWDGIYSVSDTGKIRNNKTGKLRKFRKEKLGYLSVDLWNRGFMKRLKIHRLVALAFIPNMDSKPQVNHKDGNKENNSVENLEWNTAQENSQHAYQTGLSQAITGEKHGRSKLTELEAMFIKSSTEPNKVLADEFGVSSRLVRKIKNNELWKNIS
jgi:hypothetical protein